MKPILCLLLLIVALPRLQYAQSWSLEQCIQYAVDNNITVQQSELNIQANASQLQTARFGMLPNLNAGGGLFFNWGRFIDPTTNEFITEATNTTTLNMNSSVTLFSGGRIRNTIEQNKANLAASEYARDNTALSIALTITQAYLTVLVAKENLGIAQDQLANAQQQLSITQKFVTAGTLPEGNQLEVEAQVAQAELQVVNAENDVDLSLLRLQLTMLMEPTPGFNIQNLTGEVDEVALQQYGDVAALFNQALGTHPLMLDAEQQYRSAELGVRIARAGYFPSLSLNGGLGTTHSSARRRFEQGEATFPVIGLVQGANTPVVSTLPFFTTEILPYPYLDQLNDNLNRQLGVSLQIPIFNRNLVKNGVVQSNLGAQSSQLLLEQRRNTLRDNIYTAYLNAQAAAKRYAAAENNLTATERSFEYTKKRAEQGVVTPFDFSIAQNNLNIARANLAQAKYQYLLSLKVLDFNIGKPLQLK